VAPEARTATPRTQTLKPVAAHTQDLNPVIKRYCAGCHSDKGKAGGLSLAAFDVTQAAQNAEVSEKVIRKLQAGFMPPPLAARPDPDTYAALIAALESGVDAASAVKPNPGVRTFQRLNRPEYARAVKDLLALDVDAGSWLPLDTKSANFDNIADAQALSPTLLEAYLNAASAISRMAVGDRNAPTVDSTYSSPGLRLAASVGSRRGRALRHARRLGRRARVPGRRRVRLRSRSRVRARTRRFEDIDISDRRRARRAHRVRDGPAGGADGRGAVPMRTEPILIKAGQHLVAAAFVRKIEGRTRI
jgi:hypothetical protein